MKPMPTRRALLLLLSLLFLLTLTACGGQTASAPGAAPAEPTAESTEPTPEPTPTPVPELTIGSLTIPETAEELALEAGQFDFDTLLEALPRLSALKTLDLPGTDLSPEQLDTLRAAAGEALHYSLDLGGLDVDGDVGELSLEAGQFDADTLLAAIPRLPNLASVSLPETDLSAEQLEALRAAAGDTLHYSLDLGGQIVDGDLDELSLEAGQFDADALLAAIPCLPKLTSLNLPETDLTAEQLEALRAAAGDTLHYSLDLGGKIVDGDLDELSLDAGQFDADALLGAIPRLPKLTSLNLPETDLAAEQLEALRAAAGDTLHYSLDLGGQTVDGDVEELSLASGLFDFDALLGAIPRLPALKSLELPETDLSPEQLHTLRADAGKIMHYSLDLGGQVVDGDAETLSLEAGQFDYDALLAALPCLPSLTSLDLPETDLSPEQLDTLRAEAGDMLHYSLDLGGQVVDGNAETLSLEAGQFDFDTLLAALPRLPSLASLDLPETDLSREQLDTLCAAAGDVSTSYTVNLAGHVVDGSAESLDLSMLKDGEFPIVLERLDLFPSLRSIELKKANGRCSLSRDEIRTLAEAVPDADLSWSVRVGSTWYDRSAEKADLSKLRPAQLDDALESLSMLEELREVELTGRKGSSPFDKAEVRRIQEALPNADTHYEFELFGRTISTLDERVEFEKIALTDADEPAIREALDLLTHCRYFKLDEDKYGISNEVMASIRDDYPETKVVWRVFVAGINMLTDEEILRVTFVVNDRNSAPLRYCTDAVFLDLGHNSHMSDISFLAYMPNLECCILSGSPIRSLAPAENCSKLVWMECCFCGYLTDISAMEGKTDLRYLNISATAVSDISALEDLELERMVAMNARIPRADQEHFQENHPDCLTAWYGDQPYGYPWRYDAQPEIPAVYSEYYARMRKLFCYDDKAYWNGKYAELGPGYLALRDN